MTGAAPPQSSSVSLSLIHIDAADEEARPHIFEPFFTTKSGGTGLGLATVHGIVEQSGGRITLDSTEGQGSSFEVRFPKTSEPLAPRRSRSSGHLLAVKQDAATILLVEDEPLVRRANARILEAAGYRVLVAGDGEEALALADAHVGTIQLLLTDVVMPKMTGPELTERLTTVRPGVRVLLVSGYPGEVVVPADGKLGTIRFLQKPFESDQLLSNVRAALRERRD